MRGLIVFLLAIVVFSYARGEEKEELEQMLEEEEELLQCFRCDLGFWDACYTTETNCSLGERCFTGRGKAVDVLDVKTLGCVKAEECNVESSVELFSNNTVFTMTKYCCDTPFCNAALKSSADTLLWVAVACLISWNVTRVSTH
ncbi:protein Bouncer-like [Syngnathus typhle]|uniref:protein Bouncer-like n=1 Tax=Syngnathus typhle TaxID=161592 RepID=UPI002A6B4063|nr:protein Bouncer-like [Syngnathus typhle]